MTYNYLTSDYYTFAPDTKRITFNKTNNSLKFKQIVYTITSVNEVFNGYEYLTIYKAEALRTSSNTIRKYALEITEYSDGNLDVSRSIYYRNIIEK